MVRQAGLLVAAVMAMIAVSAMDPQPQVTLIQQEAGESPDDFDHMAWDGATYHQGREANPARRSIREYQQAVHSADRLFDPSELADASSSSYDEGTSQNPYHISQAEFLKTAHDMTDVGAKTKTQLQQASAYRKQLRAAEQADPGSKHRKKVVPKRIPTPTRKSAARLGEDSTASKPSQPATKHAPKFDRLMELGDASEAARPDGWDPVDLIQLEQDEGQVSTARLTQMLHKVEAAAQVAREAAGHRSISGEMAELSNSVALLSQHLNENEDTELTDKVAALESLVQNAVEQEELMG